MEVVSKDIHLKCLIGQVDSKFQDIDSNIEKLTSSLGRYTDKDQFDVILLPEMALTGYNFKSK